MHKRFALTLSLLAAVLLGWSATKYWRARSEGAAKAEAVLLGNDPGGVFAAMKATFPDEFDAYVGAVDGQIAVDGESLAAGFDHGHAATKALVTRNIHALARAPADNLRAVNAADVAVMSALSDQPELCARFAFYGDAGISKAAFRAIDPALTGALLRKTILALAAGNLVADPPEMARDVEFFDFLERWKTRTDPAPAVAAAVLARDLTSPLYCEGIISAMSFLNQPTAENERVLRRALASSPDP